ncbi:hypothetical protein BG011_007543 [Mortierella polycephala]|uniref:Uncharacterized protein n=1 Tax=Mortierella polycephala TaxID=41804 RepID=A0A9P6TXK3_9FUNG|nr:hypothetical protein BG011_007543 [Mortierella polycephala]
MSSISPSRIDNVQAIFAPAEHKTDPFVLHKATGQDVHYLTCLSTRNHAARHFSIGLYTLHDAHQIGATACGTNRDTRVIVDVASGRYVGFTTVSDAFGYRLGAFVFELGALPQDALYPGKLIEVRDWAKPIPEAAVEEYLGWTTARKVPVIYAASLAPLSFNILLIRERSLEDLLWSYGEMHVKDDASRSLIFTLFQKVNQHINTFYW